jgi:TRAP-type C4-dicarboxylate transport system substrate-binding protein
MMSKNTTARALLLSVIVGLGGALATGGAGAETFNANVFLPPAQPLGQMYARYANAVKDATGGAVDFKVFTGGSLVSPKASLQGIRDGIAHVGFVAGTYTPKDLPLNNVLADLTLYNADPTVTAYASTDFNINSAAVQAEWKSHNTVYGAGYSTAPYRMVCNADVPTLETLKGMKVRTPGGLWHRFSTEIGATPVNVPSSEMYTGLERGLLDCVNNDITSLKDRSLWDVATSVNTIALGTYFSGVGLGFNSAFWTGLSERHRSVLLDLAAEQMVEMQIEVVVNEQNAKKEAADKGIKFYEPKEPLSAALSAFSVDDLKDLQNNGRYGAENAGAVAADYIAIVNKWAKLLEGVDRTDKAALLAIVKREIYDKIDAQTYGVN